MFITGFDLDFTVMGEATFWLKCTGWNFFLVEYSGIVDSMLEFAKILV